jgi:DNA-binding beta-propeller fold protein YncE
MFRRCIEIVLMVVVVMSLALHSDLLLAASTFGTLEKTYDFRASSLLLDTQRSCFYADFGSVLRIIDTNTLEVSGTVSLPNGGGDMAMSPDGSKLFIADGSGIFVMDAQTHNILPHLNLGYAVGALAAGLNNRLFVQHSTQISQIDATSGSSIGSNLPVSVHNGELQISPDRKTLYYGSTSLLPSSLYKVDVSTTTPQLLWSNTSTVGSNGKSLALSHDGSMLAYVCGIGPSGYEIPNFRTSDMSIPGSFLTGAFSKALAYSPDDKYAYASHGPNPLSVYVYDTSTYQQVTQFSVLGDAYQMAFDTSGKHLFISYSGAYGSHDELCVYYIPEPSSIAIVIVAATAGFGVFCWRQQRGRMRVSRIPQRS